MLCPVSAFSPSFGIEELFVAIATTEPTPITNFSLWRLHTATEQRVFNCKVLLRVSNYLIIVNCYCKLSIKKSKTAVFSLGHCINRLKPSGYFMYHLV
jgi:hypothetical protein